MQSLRHQKQGLRIRHDARELQRQRRLRCHHVRAERLLPVLGIHQLPARHVLILVLIHWITLYPSSFLFPFLLSALHSLPFYPYTSGQMPSCVTTDYASLVSAAASGISTTTSQQFTNITPELDSYLLWRVIEGLCSRSKRREDAAHTLVVLDICVSFLFRFLVSSCCVL